MKPWVRILLISLLTVAVLAIVGVAFYRFGFQAGLSQQFAAEFGDRLPLRGGDEGGWFNFRRDFDRDGFRNSFPMLRGFHHLRPWGLGFFHPGSLLGLLVLALLVYVFVRAFSTPAPSSAKPTRPRRK